MRFKKKYNENNVIEDNLIGNGYVVNDLVSNNLSENDSFPSRGLNSFNENNFSKSGFAQNEQSNQHDTKRLTRRYIPLVRILPNIITIIGLIIGVSSLRFALDERWESAVYCVIIAAVVDGIDGRVARALNVSSSFGAELDSLCDFVNFGLMPAILTYIWSLQQYEYKIISWAAIIFFVVCMALRLARFNDSMISSRLSQNNVQHNLQNEKEKRSDKDKKRYSFLVGVPAPAGALLALIPIILDLQITKGTKFLVKNHTLLIDSYIAIIAVLLASRFPTISLSNIRVRSEYISLLMMSFSLFIICFIIYPWYVMPMLAVSYLTSIVFCIFWNKKLKFYFQSTFKSQSKSRDNDYVKS